MLTDQWGFKGVVSEDLVFLCHFVVMCETMLCRPSELLLTGICVSSIANWFGPYLVPKCTGVQSELCISAVWCATAATALRVDSVALSPLGTDLVPRLVR